MSEGRYPDERIDDFLAFLRATLGPDEDDPPEHWIHRQIQLRNHRNSIKMTVMKTAIRQEGLEPSQLAEDEALPAVDSYYDPASGFLHVDLNAEPETDD